MCVCVANTCVAVYERICLNSSISVSCFISGALSRIISRSLCNQQPTPNVPLAAKTLEEVTEKQRHKM